MGRAIWRRDFALVFSAGAVSLLGDAVYLATVMWMSYEMTGSAASTGVLMAAGSLPMMVFGMLGGVVADSGSRKGIMVACDLFRAAVMTGVAVLAATRALTIWTLGAAHVLLSLATEFFIPAQRACIPNIVEGTRLTNAMAAVSLSETLTSVVGPALAGILLARGPVAALGLNAASFVLSGILILAARLPRVGAATASNGAASPGAAAGPSTRSYLQLLKEGIGHVIARPILSRLIIILVAANLLAPAGFVLLPALAATTDLGARGFGLMLSAAAAGGVLSGVVVGWFGTGWGKGRMLRAGLLGMGVGYAWLAVAAGTWMPLASIGVFRFFSTMILIAVPALIGEAVRDELRGRVTGAVRSVAVSTAPLAQLMGGFLGAFLPLRSIIAACGIGLFVVGATMPMTARALVEAKRPG